MQTFTHHYSSDITREQFNLIRSDLEGARKRTAPRHIDPYDMFYVLNNGCSWRDLPADYLGVFHCLLLYGESPTPDKPALFTQVFKNCL